MDTPQDGFDAPPGGSIGSILGGGDQAIPPGIDIRKENTQLRRTTPMGPSYAVDVQEILKRGFKALDIDEQATVIAAYLANQKQQLSPYLTPFDEEIARGKHVMEVTKSKEKRVIRAIFIAAIIGIIGVVLYGAIKVSQKGVMGDSGNTQGLIMMAQEIIRVIFSGGNF